MKLLDKCVSLNPMCKSEVATVVYGNNYRKLTEDSVVLSREEYEKLKGRAERREGGRMTEKEQIEEMEKTIDEMYNVYITIANIAEGLYNAGYRTIKGV